MLVDWLIFFNLTLSSFLSHRYLTLLHLSVIPHQSTCVLQLMCWKALFLALWCFCCILMICLSQYGIVTLTYLLRTLLFMFMIKNVLLFIEVFKRQNQNLSFGVRKNAMLTYIDNSSVIILVQLNDSRRNTAL